MLIVQKNKEYEISWFIYYMKIKYKNKSHNTF